MSATRPSRTAYVGAPRQAPRGRALCSPAEGRTSTTCRSPGMVWAWRSSAARTRTRASRASTSARRARRRGRRRRVHRRRPRRRLEGRRCRGLAGDGGHEERHRTSRSRPTRRATRATGSRSWLPRRRALAKDAAELVEVDYEPLPAVVDVEAALEDGAPLVHEDARHEQCYVVDARQRRPSTRRSPRRTSIVKRALLPAAPDPERDRAARRARRARRRPATSRSTSATQIPHILRLARCRDARDAASRSCASSRPTSAAASARSSTSTPRSCSRSRSRAGSAAGASGRRSAPRGTWRRSTAATSSQEIELAATKDGKITRCPGERARGDGRVPAARDARASRCSAPGSTPGRTTSRAYGVDVHGRVHEHDADGRLPRRGPARGDVRRSSGRWTRSRASSAWTGSSCAARTSSRSSRTTIASGLTIDSGDYDASLDKLPRAARLRRAPRRAGERGATAATSSSSAIGFSTYNEMCGLAPSRILGAIRYAAGGWESATVRVPADRLGAGGHRHLAARAGSRDGVGADRRRPARVRASTSRGAARRHRGLADRAGHLRQPQPPGRRRRALAREPRR